MKLPDRRRLLLAGGLGGLTAALIGGYALAGHTPARAATSPSVTVVKAAAVTTATPTPEPTTPEATESPAAAETPAAAEAPATPEPAEAPGAAADATGGHADNPADANANHDFNGQE